MATTGLRGTAVLPPAGRRAVRGVAARLAPGPLPLRPGRPDPGGRAGCGCPAPRAGWTIQPWRPATTCAPTPPIGSIGTPRSSARSAPRSGSAPACPTRTSFVRLCDVDPRRRSRNVCDGLVSLSGADEVSCAAVRLWPTAHRFKAATGSGSRCPAAPSPLRAQPRHRRGTRHPATTLRPAGQEVYHDGAHPSAIILPVRQTR